MSDDTEFLTTAEATKLTLAVSRGLTPPFTREQLIAEGEKVCAWAQRIRIDGALLAGLLSGKLGVKFEGTTGPEPEAKFFRLVDAPKAREPSWDVLPLRGLAHEADLLIEERLDTDGSASETWLLAKMRECHPEHSAEQIQLVVAAVFAARKRADVSGTPAELLEHAAELERYIDGKAGGDRTEGDVR